MYKIGDQFLIKSSDTVSKIVVIDPFIKKYIMELPNGELDQIPFNTLPKLIEAGFVDYVGIGCNHSFQKYEGIFNTYDFCTKCDLKR